MTIRETVHTVARQTMKPRPEPAKRVRATSERKLHNVDVVIDRCGAERIDSGVMALHRNGSLTDSDLHAAERFYADYALAVHGARDSEKTGGGGSPDSMGVAVIHASAALTDAIEAVGSYGKAILVAFVVDGLSLAKIAQSRGENRQVLTGIVISTIKRLSDHYYAVDNRPRFPMKRARSVQKQLASLKA
ncbi:hypothetical protein SAMN02746095_02935 [Acidocella aminolytica 101 = DSM 11237]|uniref:Uncharacterized protein n=3 Tax=Acidocella TaxID=50709 RepID=A0A0D6PF18_9PROT|nr:hypothetical protein Aam_030_031 [Acidocella aminolytica 101 = DSM 11237]GBQ32087.1 hypothetical protein AA11237_0066 [Acidocella aminolytica 101 = DSM 11237]SHF35417.1 hypothetical protein SAMN02746095_02935 [Acidocella aminolytica 101 = DSM 11237]